MLVLTRKLNERVRINGDTWVQVVYIGQGKVRLGITAPPEVEIVREELIGASQGDSHAPVPPQAE